MHVGVTGPEPTTPSSGSSSALHPACLGYQSAAFAKTALSVRALDISQVHPVFWSASSPEEVEAENSSGVELEMDKHLLKFYYNHHRPEMYDSRKELTSTLSNRGARLAKEVGKGLALINVRAVDGQGTLVRRVMSAVPVTREEVESICRACDERSPCGDAVGGPEASWAMSEVVKGELGSPTAGKGEMLTSPVLAPSFQFPSTPDSRAGKGETAMQDGLGVVIEVSGSVHAQPLYEWIKLCVDQALHDYLIERLLASVKQRQGLLKGLEDLISPGTGAEAKTGKNAATEGVDVLAGVNRVMPILEALFGSSLMLENPSIRRQEATETVLVEEVPPLMHAMCRVMSQVHVIFQSTLALFRRGPEGLKVMDSADLLLGPGGGPDASALGSEYISLCGLRLSFPRLESTAVSEPMSIASPVRMRSKASSGLEGDGLNPQDVLYPSITAADGATPEMNALRQTGRETICLVRFTPESQTLYLYNAHPEFYGRCAAAFLRVVNFAALQRFVLEGMCLQRLGLLALDLEWWKQAPGASALLEAGRGLGKGLLSPASAESGGAAPVGDRKAEPLARQESEEVQGEATSGGAGSSKQGNPPPKPDAAMTAALAARYRGTSRGGAVSALRRKPDKPVASTPGSIGQSGAGQAKKVKDHGGDSAGAQEASIEAILSLPPQWISGLAQGADASVIQATRSLSRLLCVLMPRVQVALTVDKTLAQEILAARDPVRVLGLRLWRVAVSYLRPLNARAKLIPVCKPWTWWSHHLVLQQRGAQLEQRIRRPLEIPLLKASPKKVNGNEVTHPASDQGEGQAGQAHKAGVRPVKASDIRQLLQQCRLEGVWSEFIVKRKHERAPAAEGGDRGASRPSSGPQRPTAGPGDAPPSLAPGAGKKEPEGARGDGQAEGGGVEETKASAPAEGSRPPTPSGVPGAPSHRTHRSLSLVGDGVFFGAQARIRRAHSKSSSVESGRLETSAAEPSGGDAVANARDRVAAAVEDQLRLFAAGFVEDYLRYLTEGLKMQVIRLLVEEAPPGTPTAGGGQVQGEPVSTRWSAGREGWPLKAYLRRYILATSTILLLELTVNRRDVLKRDSGSELTATCALYTLDVPSVAVGTVPALPTTHNFTWPSAPLRGRPLRAADVRFCPAEVAGLSSQLLLHTRVYDFLVSHIMEVLSLSTQEGISPTGRTALRLVRHMIQRYQQPPR
jgi:hypothetical protein